jgi:replication factor C subunit 1
LIGDFTTFLSDHRINIPFRPASLKSGFKKPGKNGTNVFRAVLITGPPGIGKTTSAHLCAKVAGFTPIEMNASDARSKKLVEVSLFYVKRSSTETDITKNGMNINNTSLDGYVKGNVSLILAVFILPRSFNARKQILSALLLQIGHVL